MLRRFAVLTVVMLAWASSPQAAPAQETPAQETPAQETPAQETLDGAVEADETQTDDAIGSEDAEGLAADEHPYEPDQRGVVPDEPEQGPDDEAPPGMEIHTTEVVVDFEESDRRDALGLSARLWLGAGYTRLDALHHDNLVHGSDRGGLGGSVGASFGVHFGNLSLGPRIGYVIDTDVRFATLGLEFQLELGSRRARPYLRASLSYATLFALAGGQGRDDISGLITELAFGYVLDLGGPWQAGAELGASYLFLERDGHPDCSDCGDASFDLRRSGSADGLGLRLQLFSGVRF